MNEEIKKDINRYTAIETMRNSEGGKIIKEQLENDFISLIDELINKYKDKTVEGLIPIIAQLDITLKQLRIFSRAELNKNLALEALKAEEKKIQES